MPQKFYYCVPENLITADEVPEYAGLVYYTRWGSFKEIKKAPKLHDVKFKVETWKTLAMKKKTAEIYFFRE